MPSANKSKDPKPENATRRTGSEVVRTLQNADEALSWRTLSVGLNSLERKGLRDLLRGLVRSGEISQDDTGAYHALVETELEIGLLERRGRTLLFDGIPIAMDRVKRDLRLRAGDNVQARRVATDEGDQIRVLGVVEHSSELIVGELCEHARYPYVESLSPDYKGRISLVQPPEHGAHGDTVSVRIVDQDRRGYVGSVESLVSERGGARHAADTLIASYGLPTAWSKAVVKAAKALPDSVDVQDHPKRRDLIDMALVTIDGESAKDFDDAVFAESDGDGWRLLVAIADVAHYVTAGSALDTEAQTRGNSVYLPDRVVPMLPEGLSNELCSLQPDQVRLAMVCDMRVSSAGEVTDFEFQEAIIRSKARLTYAQVQGYLDGRAAADLPDGAGLPEGDSSPGGLPGGGDDPEICASLDALKELLAAFTAARLERGALDFVSHEATLELADDKPVALHPTERLDAHRLIEEAMIAANVCAAKFLDEVGALYRVHDAPQADRAELVRQAFAAAGVTLAKELSGKNVQQSLAQLHDRPDQWIFEMLVLRSMPQAVYSPGNHGHFGLALERYMHFTSPIRRYADLVVHRAIKSRLHNTPEPMSADALVACGEALSNTERRAEELGYRVEGWLKCELVSPKIGEIFDGVVMGVTDFGLFVELTGHYVQGLLHVSELGEDYFRYQPVAMALVGESSGRRFALGDSLSVQLADVEPALGRLDLALAPKPGAPNPIADKTANERSRNDRSGNTRSGGGQQRRGGGNSGGGNSGGGNRSRSDKPRKRRRGGRGKNSNSNSNPNPNPNPDQNK